jgi:hypothetical protein
MKMFNSRASGAAFMLTKSEVEKFKFPIGSRVVISSDPNSEKEFVRIRAANGSDGVKVCSYRSESLPARFCDKLAGKKLPVFGSIPVMTRINPDASISISRPAVMAPLKASGVRRSRRARLPEAEISLEAAFKRINREWEICGNDFEVTVDPSRRRISGRCIKSYGE